MSRCHRSLVASCDLTSSGHIRLNFATPSVGVDISDFNLLSFIYPMKNPTAGLGLICSFKVES